MNRNIYSFILRYSKRQQIIISLITIASFPFIYASLILPKIIVNDAISGTDFPKSFFGVAFNQQNYLIALCVALLLLYLINGLFLMGLNTFKNATSERMIRRLRYMLFQRILRFPTQHFERVSQGELSTMIAGEVELIREFISDAFALPLFQGGTLLVILFFMFAQDPVLGFSSILLIPVQAYITPKLQRRINLLGKERVERARRLSGRVSEAVSGIRDLRSNGTYQYSLADFSKHLEGIYKVRYKIFQIKFFMKFLNNFLLKLTPLLFYAIGGILIIDGRLSLGALVAVIAAYSQLTAPWRELLRYYQRRGDATIKYEQLVNSFELDNLLPEATMLGGDKGEKIDDIAGQLVLNNVIVELEDGSRALDGVSLQAAPGTKVAVVAEGISRDKLAHAVTGLIATDGGEVLVDGHSINRLPIAVKAAGIGYLGSDSYVFEGSIGYNSIYSLMRKVPSDAPGASYDLEEAQLSGNCLYDADADWLDIGSARVADRDALMDWWYEVVQAVELKDLLFQRALVRNDFSNGVPDELAQNVIAARKTIAKHPKLQDLVHRFDVNTYNPNASIAANIAFGEPRGAKYDFTKFGEFSLVRKSLVAAGLDDEFKRAGIELSHKLIDLFGAADPDNALLKRFQFVSADRLEVLRDIVMRTDKNGADSLKEPDHVQLISLVCQLIVERHRLGVCDDTMLEKIIVARKYFNENLPDDERDLIASYDPDKFNDRLPMRANLIMGRVNLRRARAEQQVNELVRDISVELGLDKRIVVSAFEVECGIGGQSLPQAARQSLILARNLIKRPKILVINDGLSGHDRDTRRRIMRNITKLQPEMLMFWIDSEKPAAEDFDQIITIRDGRIESHEGRPAEDSAAIEPPSLAPVTEAASRKGVAMAGTETEGSAISDTGPAIDAEARVLSQISLFKGIAPANLKLLAFGSKRVKFSPGELLTEEGIVGKTAYVILSGQVDIYLRLGTPDEQKVARITKHDLHGETALLAAVPRTASGRAVSEVEALEIDKELFLSLMESDARVATNVARLASERLAATLAQLEKTR